MKFKDWLHKIINRFWVGFILASLPWLIGSAAVWRLSEGSLALPFSAELFSQPFKLLFDHRIILNSKFLHPVSFVFSFLALVFLISLLRLFYFVLPEKNRLGISLLFLSYFYAWGAPGIDPLPILTALFSIAILVPFFRMPPPLFIWVLATTGVLASLWNPDFQFPVLWATVSLIAGHLVNFLFADRALPSRKFRTHLLRHLPVVLALSLLGFWVLQSILSLPIDPSIFQPSSRWALGWLLTLECAALAYFSPWITSRWLSIGIFSQGVFLSQTLDRFIVFLLIGLSFEILRLPVIAEKIPEIFRKAVQPLLVVSSLVLMGLQVAHFKPERTFTEVWIKTVREIDRKEAEGFLIIGEGLPFLAHFVPSRLVQDDGALLKITEKDLKALMKEYGVTDILIDKKYLTDFWKKWLQDGKSTDVPNYSVISRAITYEGKAVDTQTLKIAALKEIFEVPMKENSEMVWLKTKK